jgi:hypothetical protein
MIDGGYEGFSALDFDRKRRQCREHGKCVRRKSYPSPKPKSMIVSDATTIERCVWTLATEAMSQPRCGWHE